jgi:EmrB/QacA subfamily drug resistance transporter
MSILDTTIVNVALARLVNVFHTSIATIQWVSSGYLIAIGCVIPLTTWAIDRFGAKRTWMASILFFVVSSALCGLSWSPLSLIVFRVLQGLSGGMILPVGQTILTRESGTDRLAKVMAALMIPTLFAPMLGPVLGGLIIGSLGWRWAFYVNIPIGIVTLLLARTRLPPDEVVARRKIDLFGFLMLAPGSALLIFGLSEIGIVGRLNLVIASVFAASIVSISVFVSHAMRSDNPLLNIRLFTDRGFASATATLFFLSAAISAAMVLIPLYYQQVRGASAIHAALLLAPGALGAMVASQIGARLNSRFGARPIALIGVVVMVAGLLVFTRVGLATSEILLAAAWFFRGVGNGVASPSLQALSYATIERSQFAAASALGNITMRTGGALGVAIGALVVQLLTPRGAHFGAPNHLQGLAHAYGGAFFATVLLAAVDIVPAMLLPKGQREHSSLHATPGTEDPVVLLE